MATSHSLKAETRACGSGNLKQLRSQGLVPGVVYGPGFDNVNIQVDAREFARMLASAVSEHILVALDINGKIVKVLLKEVQHNPITNACLHVDFQAVTDTTVIHSIVPVILEGDSAGVALGGESGFLVGALSMLVSNMLFSQGVWTPWQMFSMGIIGFLAGVLFRKGLLRRTRGSLCTFGAFCAIVIYGGIMNPASVLMWAGAETLTWKTLLTYYVTGFPVDCVHAAATVFFLWIAAEPMLEKLDRIKEKYGLLL